MYNFQPLNIHLVYLFFFYIQPEENIISIMNNGKGILVVMHKDENMYVPTMIFGHLLTSSNFNDEEQKVCKHDTKSG